MKHRMVLGVVVWDVVKRRLAEVVGGFQALDLLSTIPS
jgi:hypothetical protein